MIISFEGIDGSGKSTQARLLTEHLEERGLNVHLVREPGGTPVAEQIRSILLNADLEIDPFAEMLLFSAARSQLSKRKLAPLLEKGDIVICDRFFDSTTAYQGGGRRIADPHWLDPFHRMVTGGLVPDRTYLIRVTLDTAAERMRTRSGGESGFDRMETEGAGFYGRVQEAYDDLALREPERILVVDGDQRPEAIQTIIRDDVHRLL